MSKDIIDLGNKDARQAELDEDVRQAEQAEAAAAALKEEPVYVHTFKKPFTWEDKTVESLAFDWDGLTGADYAAIEDRMIRRGRTLVTPEFTGTFLVGMAVMACTDRDSNGKRIVDEPFLRALPLRDYKVILMKARDFLLRQG